MPTDTLWRWLFILSLEGISVRKDHPKYWQSTTPGPCLAARVLSLIASEVDDTGVPLRVKDISTRLDTDQSAVSKAIAALSAAGGVKKKSGRWGP